MNESEADQRNTSPPKEPAGRKDPGSRISAAGELAKKRAQEDVSLGQSFTDSFDRPALGPDWRTTGGGWRIADGRLCGQRVRNKPVWLARKLPLNARIEFDAVSDSEDGDIKAEFWGDGASFARSTSYTNATSYLAIYGGWKNRFHVLARQDEHAKTRKQIEVMPEGDEARARPVEPERVYRFKVERNDGKTVRWWVDEVELLSYPDDEPLAGNGHDHFGFNNWEVRVCFDNLAIVAL